MQEYVQKSMRTTLPRRDFAVNGGELSQAMAPLKSGMGPSSPRTTWGWAARTGRNADFAGPSAFSKCVSALAVLTKENLVSRLVSQPSAMATTPTITATPRARRIQTSKANERFIAAKTFFPARSAIASEVAAPNAIRHQQKRRTNSGPRIAAPVKIKPRIGPAHGAQSKPVDIPSRNDLPRLLSVDGPPCSRPPARTNGRVKRVGQRWKKQADSQHEKNDMAT